MNYSEHRYQLESPKLTGHRQQKTTCPNCGRKRCFVKYVDTQNECRYIDEHVGRCDHEQSCGYHYKPSDYFQDHPWIVDNKTQTFKPVQIPPPKPLQPLPMVYVEKSHSPNSIFWQWFTKVCARQLNLNPEIVQRIYDNYHIGATSKGEVIFWQIDELQRVRSGHIMSYSPDGHRHGWQSWTHSRMIAKGLLPKDFQLQQCFFGQHLFLLRKEAHVCIVESEKTALIMAALYPEQLWIATCGSSGLSQEKLECLRSYRFTLFPDSGCYKKWKAIMEKTKGFQYNISDKLEQYPPNTDIADLLLSPK